MESCCSGLEYSRWLELSSIYGKLLLRFGVLSLARVIFHLWKAAAQAWSTLVGSSYLPYMESCCSGLEYSRWLELSSIYGKLLLRLGVLSLARVIFHLWKAAAQAWSTLVGSSYLPSMESCCTGLEYSRWLELSSIYGKLLLRLGVLSLARLIFHIWKAAAQAWSTLVGSSFLPYMESCCSGLEYSRWLELSSIYGKLLLRLGMSCLACVSRVRLLDTRRVSPLHCRATWCAETRRLCVKAFRSEAPRVLPHSFP